MRKRDKSLGGMKQAREVQANEGAVMCMCVGEGWGGEGVTRGHVASPCTCSLRCMEGG